MKMIPIPTDAKKCCSRATRVVSPRARGVRARAADGGARLFMMSTRRRGARALGVRRGVGEGLGFEGRSTDDPEAGDPETLPATCPLPINIEVEGDLPYSEASRRYRRTVYRHGDWLEHRSSTRLFGNLTSTLTSGVVRSLATVGLHTRQTNTRPSHAGRLESTQHQHTHELSTRYVRMKKKNTPNFYGTSTIIRAVRCRTCTVKLGLWCLISHPSEWKI